MRFWWLGSDASPQRSRYPAGYFRLPLADLSHLNLTKITTYSVGKPGMGAAGGTFPPWGPFFGGKTSLDEHRAKLSPYQPRRRFGAASPLRDISIFNINPMHGADNVGASPSRTYLELGALFYRAQINSPRGSSVLKGEGEEKESGSC